VLKEEIALKNSKLNIDWNLKNISEKNYSLEISKFRRYLMDKGFRESTIEGYVGNVHRYLEFSNAIKPTAKDIENFRGYLYTKNLSRSTSNQYAYAIKAYHQMLGDQVEFARITPNNTIPYFFSTEEINKIFSVIYNLKHLAMLKTLFFGCLRASELCGLDDEDLDLKNLTVRIRNGKGGKDGIAFISDECASILKEYLEIRPQLEIKGRRPLFYTDFGNCWRREDLHHMFTTYKKRAGIEKRGGVHVFARQSTATMMIANGADISVVRHLLRHSDIRTTLRYIIVSDKMKRDKYEKFLIL
jgi:integrase/recombinase XerD